MDPLSVISLASNIVAFVDFTSKLVSRTYEVYSSASRMTDDHADLAKVIEDVHAVTRRLSDSTWPAVTDDDTALLDLVKKCRKLSEDFVQVLKKLQTKNPRSKSESLRVAWRAMREKGNLESLEKRIDRYRRQVLDRIIIMMSEDTSSTYKLLQQTMKTNETSALQTRKELQELREMVLSLVEQLRLNDIHSQLEPENTTQPVQTPGPSRASLVEVHTMLSRVTQMTATISREDWILNKLSFNEMHDRELSIEDAHTNTFRWLLYDPSDETPDKGTTAQKASKNNQEMEATQPDHVPEEPHKPTLPSSESWPKDASDLPKSSESSEAPKDGLTQIGVKEQEREERKKTRLKFLSWLNSGNGVFHISGKLGSGKSTLMKFLSEDPRTKQELQRWAGSKRLVFGQFFFWASGDPMQRSLEGLYRSILWETLRQCPSLMRDVFPRCWDADFNAANERLKGSSFTTSELMVAFELLTKSKAVFNKHKICFFIDGLDEFAGDHWKLARALKAWSDASDLKICVSSRPDNEFIHTFTNPDKHLQLHELTRQDIQKFVEDEFEHENRSFGVWAQDKRYVRLVDILIDKADGVFLWVRLATREMLSGIGNSYSISQLEEELDQLPEGLEALFRKLLSSIRKPDRMRAARTFRVMMNDLSFRGMNKLVVVHAVIDELSDADYDVPSLYTAELGPSLTMDDIKRMTRTVQDRINSRCKGLIQISKRPLFQRDDQELAQELVHLDFIHRSIYAFLAMPDIGADLVQLSGPSFDPAKFMCMAFLRLLKGSQGLVREEQMAVSEEDCLTSPGWDREVPFGSYFWLLEKLAMPILVATTVTETKESSPCLREFEMATELLEKLSTCLPVTPAPTEPIFVKMVGYALTPVKFLSGSNAIEAQRRAWLALCSLFGAKEFVLEKVSQLPDLLGSSARVDLLLLASAGNVNVYPGTIPDVKHALVISLLECGISPNRPLLDAFQYVPVMPSFPRVMEERQTTWTMFLRLTATLLQNRHRMPESAPAEDACNFIGHYLEFGADPSVIFVGYQIVLPEEGPNGRGPSEGDEILVGPSFFDLGQLVELWDPLNKQDLLALWKRKNQTPHTLWDMGRNFTRSFLQSKPVPRIPPIETESLRSSIFLTVTVISAKDLPKIDVSDVRRWEGTTEGRQWLLKTKGAYHRETWSIEI